MKGLDPLTRVPDLASYVVRGEEGVWNLQGTILSASLTTDIGNLWEPSVIYEDSPQILTTYENVFKMWFCSGFGIPGSGVVNYAESPDGIHWTRRVTPVLTNHYRTFVLKQSTTYYLFGATVDQLQIDVYTSSDGITWTLGTAAILAVGTAGAWDDFALANCSVFVEGGTWYMLYDGLNDASGVWSEGLATASSPTGTWTKSGSNPVMTLASTAISGASPVIKVGSIYYVWIIRTPTATGNLPSDIYRYQSTNLTTWTNAIPSLVRTTVDEGVNTLVGQVGDPYIFELGGKTFIYYCASQDGSADEGFSHLKLAIADMPISQLITTSEGVIQGTVGAEREGFVFGLNPTFVDASYENSWVTYTTAPHGDPAGFYKDREGFVHLRGHVKDGTLSLPIFRLPVGLRPITNTLCFAVVAQTTPGTVQMGQINVEPDGDVVLVAGGTGLVSLDGITFAAEQ